jgi:hypothetical protein
MEKFSAKEFAEDLFYELKEKEYFFEIEEVLKEKLPSFYKEALCVFKSAFEGRGYEEVFFCPHCKNKVGFKETLPMGMCAYTEDIIIFGRCPFCQNRYFLNTCDPQCVEENFLGDRKFQSPKGNFFVLDWGDEEIIGETFASDCFNSSETVSPIQCYRCSSLMGVYYDTSSTMGDGASEGTVAILQCDNCGKPYIWDNSHISHKGLEKMGMSPDQEKQNDWEEDWEEWDEWDEEE